MILCIKTDNPTAELYSYENSKKLAEDIWVADRTLARDLLARIEKLVGKWEVLSGIVIFEGPGSFTGLRIGITVANALADGLHVPIVGTRGDAWLEDGLELLKSGTDSHIVLPHYGADPHITQPRK